MTSGFDELLERRKKGSLKIYLGFSAGVGKTFAMLQEAHRLKARGFDVVIGYVEPHERPETTNQIGSLEVLPRRFHVIGDRSYEEMDLSGILKRKPQIVLVDELAHTNAPGTKNEKRYEDVIEILDKKINVISTLNIQHLESIAEKVQNITGVDVRERLPDSVLGRADQIVNVDVSIEELRERMRQGRIYKPEQAEIALRKFFTIQNLALLRETALKEVTGDQARRIQQEELLTEASATIAHEDVMVALSSDPSNAEVLIREGAKLASQFSSRCYVVYIRRKMESPTMIDSAIQRKLQNNLKLAKSLGTEVVTLDGEKIAETLVNFAQENNIRHVIFGKSRLSPLRERLRGSVLLNFIHDSVGIKVHIIPTPASEKGR
jgi:two-component system sensor histidine kinase KdpD